MGDIPDALSLTGGKLPSARPMRLAFSAQAQEPQLPRQSISPKVLMPRRL
jgi:hypothetical protein